MKALQFFFLLTCFVFFSSCVTSNTVTNASENEKPVVISNDNLEYEVIIIDQGFNLYLNTIAKPVGFYSQAFLENKNSFFVSAWNIRANNPTNFNPNIYENIIDYNSHLDYGYEVNYKLFNYFEFAQQKYNMRLR